MGSAGADVWSFGCVALFAWGGKHPCPEVYEALCGELLGSADVQALAVVARSCLQPQPSDRPAFSMLLRSLQLCDWPHNSGSSACGSARCTDNSGTGVSTNTNSHVSTVPHGTSCTSQEDVVFGVSSS